MQPEILYQDRHIAVVVKPAGVMSQSPGMPELLRDSLGGAALYDGKIFLC